MEAAGPHSEPLHQLHVRTRPGEADTRLSPSWARGEGTAAQRAAATVSVVTSFPQPFIYVFIIPLWKKQRMLPLPGNPSHSPPLRGSHALAAVWCDISVHQLAER